MIGSKKCHSLFKTVLETEKFPFDRDDDDDVVNDVDGDDDDDVVVEMAKRKKIAEDWQQRNLASSALFDVKKQCLSFISLRALLHSGHTCSQREAQSKGF